MAKFAEAFPPLRESKLRARCSCFSCSSVTKCSRVAALLSAMRCTSARNKRLVTCECWWSCFLYGVVCGQVCGDVSVSCNGTSVCSARLNPCLPLFAPACVRVIIVKCGVLMQSRRAGVLLFHCLVSEEVRDLLYRQIRILKRK